MSEDSIISSLRDDSLPTADARWSRRPEPCALVIFGITGDLAHRKIVPALCSLIADRQTADSMAVVGVGRRDIPMERLLTELRAASDRHARRRPVSDGVWSEFARRFVYHHGAFDDPATYEALRQRLRLLDETLGTHGNRVFYLATPPDLFLPIVRYLGRAGLICSAHEQCWSRVVVEKPFGHDLQSARDLNAGLAQVLREDQTYRIDHYLGKETVRNLLVFRFANTIFEPVWTHQYIDHVQITVAESIGVDDRGEFFDKIGTLRDMIQNHLLQLLSIVAMEPPSAVSPELVRDEKLKVLRAIRRMSVQEALSLSVRGQYGPGMVNGENVPGYRHEEGVRPDSPTETYAALRLDIENWRWSGTPFYLRAGKRLPKRVTEIAVQFRRVPHMIFPDGSPYVNSNVLVLRIQPDEGIALRLTSKVPGQGTRLQPVRMEFRYGSVFGVEPPDAYERLLLDVMLGDSTLFNRGDEVEAAWEVVAPVLEAWQDRPVEFPNYPAGTWGPPAADEFIRRDGRSWRRP
ncbi:MAG: glucose-6-phosphate dehydrogenase [Armatimonadota bacterium]